MSNSDFYLIKLADIVNRKVKSVQVVEVKDSENCTVIVLEKRIKKNRLRWSFCEEKVVTLATVE